MKEKKEMIKRRKILIDPHFQWRYTRAVLIPVVLAILLVVLAQYFYIWSEFKYSLTSQYHQDLKMTTFELSAYVTIITLCLVIPFIIFLGIRFSHRISGPIFSIKRNLDKIGKGELTIRIKLRKKDELKDLAECINIMTQDLGKMVLEIKRSCYQVKGIVSDTAKGIDKDKVKRELEQLEKTLNKLKINDKE